MHVVWIVVSCLAGVVVAYFGARARIRNAREWDYKGDVDYENEIARQTRIEWARGRRKREP